MKIHYHVISGGHGYIPDYNAPYPTKKEALEALREYIKYLRDDGCKFRGSLKDEYFECLNPRICGLEYVQLIECDADECLEEEDFFGLQGIRRKRRKKGLSLKLLK